MPNVSPIQVALLCVAFLPAVALLVALLVANGRHLLVYNALTFLWVGAILGLAVGGMYHMISTRISEVTAVLCEEKAISTASVESGRRVCGTSSTLFSFSFGVNAL